MHLSKVSTKTLSTDSPEFIVMEVGVTVKLNNDPKTLITFVFFWQTPRGRTCCVPMATPKRQARGSLK